MAYVVARPNGRFEIRESHHTSRGPRARTLAGFTVLSESTLDRAASRASRPFDAQSVLASARRAGAPIEQAESPDAPEARSAFLAASRRMASVAARPRPERARADPGTALIELLGFTDAVMSSPPGIARKILALHEMLDSLRAPHQFGGAIALAWYRSPRATTDIDVNLTLAPGEAAPVLAAIEHLGVRIADADREAIARDGQARLDWDGAYLDVFFATLDLHREMLERARTVSFGASEIPILSPEDLIVCKAVFDRPKDWVDIEEIVGWGTKIAGATVLGWMEKLLGVGSEQSKRLAALFVAAPRSMKLVQE